MKGENKILFLLQNDHPVGGISADVIEDINFDLTTNAKNLPGAINELNGKSSTTVSVTQAEYDALPSSKLTDDIAYYIKDGVPDVDNALWNKVGTATLETTSKDCSGAINELNSSLAISAGTITPSSGVTVQAYTFVKIGHICVLSFALRCPNISSGGTIATLPYSSAVATFNTVQDNDNIINYLKVEGNRLITDIAKSSSQVGLVIGEIVYITRS